MPTDSSIVPKAIPGLLLTRGGGVPRQITLLKLDLGLSEAHETAAIKVSSLTNTSLAQARFYSNGRVQSPKIVAFISLVCHVELMYNDFQSLSGPKELFWANGSKFVAQTGTAIACKLVSSVVYPSPEVAAEVVQSGYHLLIVLQVKLS